MIRSLSALELPCLLSGAHAFFNEGRVAGTLNEAHLIKALAGFINSGAGFVLVDEVGGVIRGAISGVIHPDPWTGDLVAMEGFWFVLPEFRSGLVGPRLLKAFELECKSRAAKRILMIFIEQPDSAKFKQFYERSGYRHLESIYLKENN